MENNQSIDFIKALLSGKEVKCPVCGKGILTSDTDPSNSHFFYCTDCDNTVNIN